MQTVRDGRPIPTPASSHSAVKQSPSPTLGSFGRLAPEGTGIAHDADLPPNDSIISSCKGFGGNPRISCNMIYTNPERRTIPQKEGDSLNRLSLELRVAMLDTEQGGR